MRELFDQAARDYDRVESLMAFGSGPRYRRDALVRAGLASGMRVLDVAIGTGLVAREALRVVGPGGAVVGIDVSAGMLGRAAASLPVRLVQARSEGYWEASLGPDPRISGFRVVVVGYKFRIQGP